MPKNYHLISNAHLDPVWQWEWEEGAAAAISTFRCAAKFCREFDGYVFCHNESLIYKWVEENEPSLFDEIKELVELGRWHIMGGWHVQPDCNMPSGEGFARSIASGRRYFKEKFGKEPTTAINFDPFGHTRGLVQIMAKSGYDSYMFCRPNPEQCYLEANTFIWEGYDGSRIIGQRDPDGYGSLLGKADERVRSLEDRLTRENAPTGVNQCLWGVGDHGGGPSREDIIKLNAYIEDAKQRGINAFHSTPENYFKDVKEHDYDKLPVHKGDINTWAPGCYTSQVLIKQTYRQAENMLFSTEKMWSRLSLEGKMPYPEKELSEALEDILTIQFHDILPGSSIKPAQTMAIRMLNHSMEIVSKLRFRAFLLFADGQKEGSANSIPLLVYNPHPFPVETDISVEFMLQDQVWDPSIFYEVEVFDEDGNYVPSQCEKETSNLPLEWRKKITFHAKLKPSSMNRFDGKLVLSESKPKNIDKYLSPDKSCYVIGSDSMKISINCKTGRVDSMLIDGTEYLAKDSFAIDVYEDSEDSWGMTKTVWEDKVGEFTLMNEDEATELAAVFSKISPIHLIEDGNARVIVETEQKYKSSAAVVRYIISKVSNSLEVSIRLFNNERRKMIKLRIPQGLKGAKIYNDVAFGEEPAVNHRENPGQKYWAVDGENKSLVIMNQGIYGSSVEDNVLLVSLLHSPGFTAHPLGDRLVMAQDRFDDHMDIGEREFMIKIEPVDGGHLEAAKKALAYNESPMAISFFPTGKKLTNIDGSKSFITLDNTNVIMTAMKKLDGKDDYMIRLFNESNKPSPATVEISLLGVKETLNFGIFEVKTLILKSDGTLTESRMDVI